VGSEEGCSDSHFERGGDVGVAAVHAGVGGGTRLGFWRKTKGRRLIGRARMAVRGSGGVGWAGRGRWAAAGPKTRNGPKFKK
jgi:hypothetical protein